MQLHTETVQKFIHILYLLCTMPACGTELKQIFQYTTRSLSFYVGRLNVLIVEAVRECYGNNRYSTLHTSKVAVPRLFGRRQQIFLASPQTRRRTRLWRSRTNLTWKTSLFPHTSLVALEAMYEPEHNLDCFQRRR